MRKLSYALIAAVLLAAAGLVLGGRAAEAQGGAVTLQDAVARKLVNVQFHGTGDLFFREALSYTIQNAGSGDIIIVIPAGLVFTPTEESTQPLMVGQSVTLTIKAKQTAGGKLWVFCGQLSKHAPDAESVYHVGAMAEGNLLSVARVIEKHGWKGELGAQFAVWRLTDGTTQEKLLGEGQGPGSELLTAIKPFLGLAGDPFTRAETILQEAGTGLHYSDFGTPVPAQSPLPGGAGVGDILNFFQRCTSCFTCFGLFGAMAWAFFARR
jgi:hypothetical protein